MTKKQSPNEPSLIVDLKTDKERNELPADIQQYINQIEKQRIYEAQLAKSKPYKFFRPSNLSDLDKTAGEFSQYIAEISPDFQDKQLLQLAIKRDWGKVLRAWVQLQKALLINSSTDPSYILEQLNKYKKLDKMIDEHGYLPIDDDAREILANKIATSVKEGQLKQHLKQHYRKGGNTKADRDKARFERWQYLQAEYLLNGGNWSLSKQTQAERIMQRHPKEPSLFDGQGNPYYDVATVAKRLIPTKGKDQAQLRETLQNILDASKDG